MKSFIPLVLIFFCLNLLSANAPSFSPVSFSASDSYKLIEDYSPINKDKENSLSIPFDVSDSHWHLPSLARDVSHKINKLSQKINEGHGQQNSQLDFYGIKTVPLILNLLNGPKHTQKSIAPHALSISGDNGKAFIYKITSNPHQELNSIGLKEIEKLSRNAQLGIWLNSSQKNIKQSLIKKILKNKSEKKYFNIYKKSLNSKDSLSIFKNKKVPASIVNLYIDSLIQLDQLPFDKNLSSKKAAKKYQVLIKKSRATDYWKTLASLRLGTKVKQSQLKRLGQHTDWYIRARFCRALFHRKDLAWKAVPLLLERQRDICWFVRLEANKALRKLHHLPYEFGYERKHFEDSLVIFNWEMWWRDRKGLSLDFEKLEKSHANSLKLTKNVRIKLGDSTQTYDALKGKIKNPKTTVTILDVNQNGEFHDWGVDRILIGNLRKTDSLPLSRIVNIKNKFFILSIDSPNKKIYFKNHKEKAYPLKFKSNFSKNINAVNLVASRFADINLPINGITFFPQGDYQLNSGYLIKKNTEIAQITSPPRIFPIKVSPEKNPQEISYGPKIYFEIDTEFLSSSNKILLKNIHVKGQAGEIYKKLGSTINQVKIIYKNETDKELPLGIWNTKYQKTTTQMLGGLVPPLEIPQVNSYLGALNLLETGESKLNYQIVPNKALLESKLVELSTSLEFVSTQLDQNNQLLNLKENDLLLKKKKLSSLQTQLKYKKSQIKNKKNEFYPYQKDLNKFKNKQKSLQLNLDLACAVSPIDVQSVNQIQNDLTITIGEVGKLQSETASLQAEINNLNNSLTNLQSQITSENSQISTIKKNINLLKNSILGFEGQKKQYDVSLAATRAEILALDNEIKQLLNQNMGPEKILLQGASIAGKNLESFKLALKRETALQGLSIKLSDNVWDPYEIDLKKIKRNSEQTSQGESIQLFIKGLKLPFGEIEDTPIKIDLF